MSRIELKNKPLIEAMLEFKWKLADPKSPGFEEDPHYRLLLGRFSEKVESDYPFHQALPTTQIPDSMVSHMAQHRFRTSEEGWPLIQVGPGLMTVNETSSYMWDDFKQRCDEAVKSLLDAHPAKKDFEAEELTLRYINAVDLDFGKENVFNFLRNKMQTTISLPDSLFDSGRVRESPTNFNWQASFPTDDPSGIVALRLAIGTNKGNPTLIWEILAQTIPDEIPEIPAGFSMWLERAHDLTEDWFFKMIEGDLKERFSSE